MGAAQAVPGSPHDVRRRCNVCDDNGECGEDPCDVLVEFLRERGFTASAGALRELVERCGVADEQRRPRSSGSTSGATAADRTTEELIDKLFKLQDLNENGVLEESELIQLNKKVAMLHYGRDVDKEEVRAKYSDLFRSRLDPQGEPVPPERFRTYVLEVLRAIDQDPFAQQMILEQWIAEAALGRSSFSVPSMHSISDLPFLLLRSFDADPITASVLQDDSDSLSKVHTPPLAPALDPHDVLDSPSTACPDEQSPSSPSTLPSVCRSPNRFTDDLPVPRAPLPSEATSSGKSQRALFLDDDGAGLGVGKVQFQIVPAVPELPVR